MKTTTNTNIYEFELRQPNGILLASFTGSLAECHQRADRLATARKTQLTCHYRPADGNGRWRKMGTYLGCQRIVDGYGRYLCISSTHTLVIPGTGKEVTL